ncbi:MAG: putative endonuclease lcl3 [Phylliscum demangeonii]|nr:MAG: putative endonuclease lcl3 [Phylliscum demangeonii]
MPWPPWSSSPRDDDRNPNASKGSSPKNSHASTSSPSNIVLNIGVVTATLALVYVYRTYLRRIPGAASIQPHFYRRRSLFGRVTRVGDGDNFRLFHTPGGRLAGWDWFPGRRVPRKREELRQRTIHIRLAGIDAPEQAHFGRPAQPFSSEALDWLRGYVLGRRVRAFIYRRDHYDRAVSTVYVRRGLLRRDVGLQMLKRGLATVYEAKSGAEFGRLEARYRRAEWWAKRQRRGIWSVTAAEFESPRDYKTRMTMLDETKLGRS